MGFMDKKIYQEIVECILRVGKLCSPKIFDLYLIYDDISLSLISSAFDNQNDREFCS